MSAGFKRGTSFGWLVNVAATQMARDLDAMLKSKGLSLKVWPTLMCLWEREGVTQTELARMAQTPEYTTTRVLDRLETAELIERRVDPRSRRSYTIHLTKAGRRLEKTLVPLAQKVNEQHLSKLTKSEAATLLRLLTKVVSERGRMTSVLIASSPPRRSPGWGGRCGRRPADAARATLNRRDRTAVAPW